MSNDNTDIRQHVEELLTSHGFSVSEGGYGFWNVTTKKGNRRILSLRIKSRASFPYFPDDLQLSARHVRRNPGIPSDSASFLPK